MTHDDVKKLINFSIRTVCNGAPVRGGASARILLLVVLLSPLEGRLGQFGFFVSDWTHGEKKRLLNFSNFFPSCRKKKLDF